MARKSLKPEATSFEVLDCVQKKCPSCGQAMWNEYNNPRHIRTLNGVVELQLKIRRCQNKSCLRYKKAYRPEQEGSLALPQNEFGLDVIAYIGALRYQEHRSVPQIHAHLELKGICISQRTVTHLIDRYDELISLWLKDNKRLKAIFKNQGRVILAIDGMQPEIGHEVLWVIRDCLSGEILLAKTLLSSRNEDLAALLLEVTNILDVPIDGVISDGQQSIRKAVGLALPSIAHGLCHQRRCTGRKVAPSSLVIRGSVKLACAIATKLHSFTASDLAQVDIHTWLELRSQLQKHHKARIEQYRFRRDPKAYFANLESRLV